MRAGLEIRGGIIFHVVPADVPLRSSEMCCGMRTFFVSLRVPMRDRVYCTEILLCPISRRDIFVKQAKSKVHEEIKRQGNVNQFSQKIELKRFSILYLHNEFSNLI